VHEMLIGLRFPWVIEVKMWEGHESCCHWVEVVGQGVSGQGEDTEMTLCVYVCVCVCVCVCVSVRVCVCECVLCVCVNV